MKNLLLLFFLASTSALISQELYFPPTLGDEWETTSPESLGWCEDKIDGFNAFLDSTNTKGFIALKDGKIVIESYMNDFAMDDSWYWASAGKSMTAFLTGIAQEESFLDINDKTSDYLGEGWTSLTPEQESKITIRNQITMTTGLDYDPSFDCTEPSCLLYLNEPGSEWFYHNAPYTLTTNVIENATGIDYSTYMFTKLFLKTGITGLWNLLGSNRVLFSKPRSMARFGLLILNNGDWADEVVLGDKDYIHDMINSSQDINPAYGYLWWLKGKDKYRAPGSTLTFTGSIFPNIPSDAYAAIGKNGQILLIVPSQNLILVRMGANPDESLVPTFYVIDLWDEFLKIQCTSSSQDISTEDVVLAPNPAHEYIKISSGEQTSRYAVFSREGKRVLKGTGNEIDISTLPRGVYIIRFLLNEKWAIKRFVKA